MQSASKLYTFFAVIYLVLQQAWRAPFRGFSIRIINGNPRVIFGTNREGLRVSGGNQLAKGAKVKQVNTSQRWLYGFWATAAITVVSFVGYIALGFFIGDLTPNQQTIFETFIFGWKAGAIAFATLLGGKGLSGLLNVHTAGE